METEDDLKLFEIINKMLNILLYDEQLDDFNIEELENDDELTEENIEDNEDIINSDSEFTCENKESFFDDNIDINKLKKKVNELSKKYYTSNKDNNIYDDINSYNMPKKRRLENYNNIYVKRLEDILEDKKKR